MIRIGIVGCGRILAAHLRGFRLLREAGVDDFQITALCARKEIDALGYVDRNGGVPQRRAVSDIPGDPLAISEEYLSDFQPGVDVAVYTDYQKMIEEGPIDAVHDYTVHSLHHKIAELAFKHGKHLCSQKPQAITIKAAKRMCDQAAAAGVTFGVFENFRYAPGTRRIKACFEPNSVLGDLQMVLLGAAGKWWAPNKIVAETPWRHKLIEAGGIALDLGPHMFDLVRYIAGEMKTVMGRTDVVEKTRFTWDADGTETDRIDCDADDTFYASFDTESSVSGSVYGSWAGHGEATLLAEGPVFYGSKGRVTGDRLTLDGEEPKSLAESVEIDLPFGLDNDFALCALDWLEAVKNGTQPETNGDEGLRDLAAAFAVVESSLAGRQVSMNEILSGEVSAYQDPINAHYGI
ncbi:MAG: putative dehydrogenase [Verrucomicrobiales bacterium]|jgi:predicted dehydrogenase